MQFTKPDSVVTFACVGLAMLSLCARAATPSVKNCPSLMKVVNGEDIRPGTPVVVITRASGEKRIRISTEMAMTPLEFETVAGIRMRVPASAFHSLECDEKGRVASVVFDFSWVDGKLITRAETPEGKKYWGLLVHASAGFGDPSKAIPFDQRISHIERERKWYGPPEPLPQFGFTAYTRIGTKRTEKTWDAFVLDKVRDASGLNVTYLCAINDSDLLRGQVKPSGSKCRAYEVSIRKGFGVVVDIEIKMIQDATKITEQLMQTLNSYGVKE